MIFILISKLKEVEWLSGDQCLTLYPWLRPMCVRPTVKGNLIDFMN